MKRDKCVCEVPGFSYPHPSLDKRTVKGILIKGCLSGLENRFYSIVKISSIVTLNTLAIFQANTNEGLYLPFSRFPIVSLRTPTNFARSSCFISYLALYSLILFFIMFKSPIFPETVVRNRKTMHGNGDAPAGSNTV